jgi:hypothetical protein
MQHCLNHRLIGLFDFADWDSHDAITHLNPPWKMEDFTPTKFSNLVSNKKPFADLQIMHICKLIITFSN